MTASVAGRNAGDSPTHISIERNLPDLLAYRQKLLERLRTHPDSHLTAMVRASVDAQIVCWLISHVPRHLLVKAAGMEPPSVLTQYIPDVVSHPSETIRETLEALGKDWLSLHKEGGLMKLHAVHVVRGTCHITPRIADALETTTNVPASFWLSRQAQYDAWRKGVA